MRTGLPMRLAAKLTAFAAISLAAGLAPVLAANSTPNSIGVSMDEVTYVSFAKPVSAVYMGNSVIADVTMVDSRHAFILGKTYGMTNMLALGADGKIVSNQSVTVTGRQAGLVTVNRGPLQFNYACTPHCETRPIPGDPSTYFTETHAAQQIYEDMGNKAGGAAVAANAAAPVRN
jgi:hypothetical protein